MAMKGERIIINGKLSEPRGGMPDFDMLLESNYVYTRIHTLNHKPLHIEQSLEIAERSCVALFSHRFGLERKAIEKQIADLLSANKYPMGSNVVMLYLFAGCTDELRELNEKPYSILSCRQQLIYKGYTNWHSGARAIIVPYEFPFSGHQTAVSLCSHNYSLSYAKKQSADLAIRESYEGVLLSAGEYPLFTVSGDTLYTTPLAFGVADCVERRLIGAVARDLNIELTETPLLRADINRYDELFYVTPQGVHTIIECDRAMFPNIIARKVGIALTKYAERDI